MKRLIFLTLTVSAVAATISCKTGDMMDEFQISPRGGSVNVARDGNIELTFGEAADSGTVAANFHLMRDSCMDVMIDSVNMMPMSYAEMLAMMNRHAITGHFEWMDGYTRCVFDPDSILAPMTLYRIHMGQSIMQMAGMHHSGMMGMPDMMGEDMMIEFTTGK